MEDARRRIRIFETEPKKFIGREVEVASIMRGIHATLPTKNRKYLKPFQVGYQTAALQLITGGPGAGKSSLLEAIETECRKHECRVIQLRYTDLRNPTAFTNAIRDACHWRERDALNALARDLTYLTTAVDYSVGGWIRKIVRTTDGNRAEASAASSNPITKYVQPAREAVHCWQQDEPASPRDVLNLLSALKPTVITIDGGHLLKQYLGTGGDDTARTIIRTLVTPVERERMGAENCIIVIAGLNDLHPTVTNLGAFRHTSVQLGPFTDEDASDIIRHWIEQAPVPANTATKAIERWVPSLVAEYGQWPYHTIGAAVSARATLESGGEAAVENSWGIHACHEIASSFRDRLYSYIAEMAIKRNNPWDAVLAIAHSMPQRPGTIDIDEASLIAVEVINHHQTEWNVTESNRRQQKDWPTGDESVQILLHAGVLEYSGLDDKNSPPTHVRIAVPSFGDYLRRNRTPPGGPARTALQLSQERDKTMQNETAHNNDTDS